MLLESIAAAVLISGANYADYHTTRNALENRTGIEANILIGSQGQRLELVKVAAVGIETGIFIHLHKKNKKYAWLWVGTVVATNLIIANHNRKLR